MSLRLGILLGTAFEIVHQFYEVVEQVVRIVRAGRSLGMVLDAEDGFAAMAEAFERVVIEIDVGEVDVVCVERLGVDREAVVVRGDFDASGGLVEDGMVAAAMSEFQFEGLAAEGEAEDLLAQADAEN